MPELMRPSPCVSADLTMLAYSMEECLRWLAALATDLWPQEALDSVALDNDQVQCRQALLHAREASGLEDLTCLLLGPAKMKAVVDSGPMQEASLAMLQTGGAIIAYLLCAHIRDNLWLCHRGAFDGDGSVNMTDPFNERSLVPGNVM